LDSHTKTTLLVKYFGQIMMRRHPIDAVLSTGWGWVTRNMFAVNSGLRAYFKTSEAQH